MSDLRSGLKQRDTAIKVPIAELVAGVEIDDPQGRRAFQTKLGLLWRVRVLGIVLNKYSSEKEGKKPYTSLTLDDGTGEIRIKAWGPDATRLAQFERGVALDIIGRVRSSEEETYITSELEILVVDPTWELIRRLELVKQYKDQGVKPAVPSFTSPPAPSATMSIPSVEPKVPLTPPEYHEKPTNGTLSGEMADSERGEGAKADLGGVKDQLIVLIKKLDTGKGASYDELKKEMGAGSEELFEETLMDLLTEGIAYEPSSARYKILK